MAWKGREMDVQAKGREMESTSPSRVECVGPEGERQNIFQEEGTKRRLRCKRREKRRAILRNACEERSSPDSEDNGRKIARGQAVARGQSYAKIVKSKSGNCRARPELILIFARKASPDKGKPPNFLTRDSSMREFLLRETTASRQVCTWGDLTTDTLQMLM